MFAFRYPSHPDISLKYIAITSGGSRRHGYRGEGLVGKGVRGAEGAEAEMSKASRKVRNGEGFAPSQPTRRPGGEA